MIKNKLDILIPEIQYMTSIYEIHFTIVNYLNWIYNNLVKQVVDIELKICTKHV